MFIFLILKFSYFDIVFILKSIANSLLQKTLWTYTCSMKDAFFLPMHPLAIHHLQEDLHDVNKVNSTIVWKEHGLIIYFEAYDHDNGDP